MPRSEGEPAAARPAAPGLVRITRSAAETRALGARLARGLRAGDVIALVGELGAGKTVFAQGVVEGLGGGEEAASPSFTLVNVYEAALPVYHLDFYRLAGEEDVESLGFRDYLGAGGVVLVEWADRCPDSLPGNRLEITFGVAGESDRTLAFRAFGPSSARLLEGI
jgi:tRNA threonylcarbamoyladenosine biosynthesis protein TsaE